MKFILNISICALAVLAFAQAAQADDEGMVYYVNLFAGDNPGEDRCGDASTDDLSWGDDNAGYLLAYMNIWSFDRVEYHYNTGADWRYFADEDEDADGEDDVLDRGVDTGDVAFIYSHGGAVCDGDYFSAILMGDSSGTNECFLDFGDYAGNDVEWGDTDLNMIILNACQSLQLCVFEGANGIQYDTGSLVIINGFHGYSWDGSTHYGNFQDYVENSRTANVGDNWVDFMSEEDISGSDDECGVCVIFKDTETAADDVYNNGGIQDWKTPGSHNQTYYYYQDGCNPAGGPEL